MSDFSLIWNDISLINRLFLSVEADLSSLTSEHSTALTTGDVAELIGIHPSTVKRWFGGARVSAGSAGRGVSATSGGHRRISLDLALKVARERGHEVYLHGFDLDAVRVWSAVQSLDAGDARPAQRLLIDWLKAGRTRPIGRFLRHVIGLGDPGEAVRGSTKAGSPDRASRAVEPGVLDGVFGGFMSRVGAAWARGELPIRAERAASREVSEAIYALLDMAGREEEPRDLAGPAATGGRADSASSEGIGSAFASPRPTAVVATVEPDQHLLGSLLVRLMLVQRGWRVEHLGTGLPVAEIVATQQATEASLVCVSFTPPRGPADVRRFVDVAGRLADSCQPYSLVLGGDGAHGVDLCGCYWPFGSPEVPSTLADFGQWLDGHPDLEAVIPPSAPTSEDVSAPTSTPPSTAASNA